MDVVIFTVIDDQLNVLLVRRPTGDTEPYPGMWALPGGYVGIERDQELEACALYKLKEKTGVASPYLEQLGSWGSATRDPRGWTATHVYLALLPHESVKPDSGGHTAETAWYPVKSRETGWSTSWPSTTKPSWPGQYPDCATRRNTLHYRLISYQTPSHSGSCSMPIPWCWGVRWTKAAFAPAHCQQAWWS